MPRIRGWFDVIDAAGVRRPGGHFLVYRRLRRGPEIGRRSGRNWRDGGCVGSTSAWRAATTSCCAFLRKPGTAADVVDAVSTLKAAGVAVSVIVMTGVGGRAATLPATWPARSRRSGRMPLGPGDIVYFSPFFEQPGSEYGALARQAGMRPLSAEDSRAAGSCDTARACATPVRPTRPAGLALRHSRICVLTAAHRPYSPFCNLDKEDLMRKTQSRARLALARAWRCWSWRSWSPRAPVAAQAARADTQAPQAATVRRLPAAAADHGPAHPRRRARPSRAARSRRSRPASSPAAQVHDALER